MQNTIVAKGDGALATDVLASQLGAFCTPQKEEFLAKQHFLATGQVLRLSVEIPQSEAERDAKDTAFAQRREQWLKDRGHVRTPRLHGDPQRFRRELTRLERYYLRLGYVKGEIANVFPKAADDRKRIREDFKFMNECRMALGMLEHDYEKEGVPDITEGLERDFADLQLIAEPDARVAAVRQLTNADLAKLVMMYDPNEAVRIAAERRLGELFVTGR